MNATLARRIETRVELFATAVFAGAVGFAVRMVLAAVLAPMQALQAAGGAGALAFVIATLAIRLASSSRSTFHPPTFAPVQFEPSESAEIILTDEDRLEPDELVLDDADRLDRAPADEPLVLDDVLAEVAPDSRVVRLFDRRAMPTPGQLQSRIDHHLRHQTRAAAPPQDASQALSDALAELRRSLR